MRVGGGVLTKQSCNLLPQTATVQHCVNPRVMRGLIAQAIKMNIITNLAPLTPDQNTDSSTHTYTHTCIHTCTHIPMKGVWRECYKKKAGRRNLTKIYGGRL